jgi:ABC-type polysaccharide/polyol phosphate export permease
MTQAILDNTGDLQVPKTVLRRRRVGGQKDSLADDVCAALLAWPMWIILGANDIRQRYRRSVLGPMWITLSMGVLVGTMGTIYSAVFHMEIDTYLPFLCLGFVIWGFISTVVNECCVAFRENQSIIQQIAVPFSVHVLRVLWRNFIVFLHTLIIFIPIALIFRVDLLHPAIFLAVPGFAILYLNCLWLGIIVAILSTRFHDVQQIVGNMLQVIFFSTPILWPAGNLGANTLLADANPVYHLFELIRAPLLGHTPPLTSWIVAVALLVAGSLAAMALFRRTSRRIVYWL